MKTVTVLGVLILLALTGCRKTIDIGGADTLVETRTELHALDVRGDSIVAVGGSRYNYGSIFLSYDGGTQWLRFDSLSEKALYGVKWITPARIVAVGFDGKHFESNDAGATWELTQLHWENIRAIESDGQHTWMCGGKGLDSGFITRYDNPAAPQVYSHDTFIHELRSLLRLPGGTLYAGGYGLVIRSETNGITWEPTSAEGDFFIGLQHIGDAVYAAGMNGTVLHTDNQGQTWTHLKRGNNPLQQGVHWNAFAANETALFIGGEKGRVFYYSVMDKRWRKLDVGVTDGITALRIVPPYVLASTRSGRVIRFNQPL